VGFPLKEEEDGIVDATIERFVSLWDTPFSLNRLGGPKAPKERTKIVS